MLSQGNRKLGSQLIWSFGLPSGQPHVCPGMTPLCRRHCYALRLERIRPSVHRRYQDNFDLTQRVDFEQRLLHFIVAHAITLVRIHSGGDFYSPEYAGKWLRIMTRLPQVRFFCYSRAWREPATGAVLEQMAEQKNCRLWYSCDQQTGLPGSVPPGVQLAWLMTGADDVPPPQATLVFRIQPLRRQAQTRINGVRVCPEEDGVARKAPVTCERCRLCWRPLPEQAPSRIALPMVLPPS
jgi:hypothetical protein